MPVLANLSRTCLFCSGYMSPEYALDGVFSTKSDVFSFGAVVLEILSGRRNTAFYKSDQAFSLLGHVSDQSIRRSRQILFFSL